MLRVKKGCTESRPLRALVILLMERSFREKMKLIGQWVQCQQTENPLKLHNREARPIDCNRVDQRHPSVPVGYNLNSLGNTVTQLAAVCQERTLNDDVNGLIGKGCCHRQAKPLNSLSGQRGSGLCWPSSSQMLRWLARGEKFRPSV